MTDTMTLTSAPTEQTPSPSTDYAPCSRKGCRWNLDVGSGHVPNTRRIYWLVRQTEPNWTLPLTRSEVLSQELCAACAHKASFELVPTAQMLILQEYWAAENVARKERFLEREHAFLERVRTRNLALAIKREDKSPINQLFAKYGERKEKHGKTSRRRGRTEQRDITVTTPEPTKGKSNVKKEQGGRRKGGR